jgi:hypothetical protein
MYHIANLMFHIRKFLILVLDLELVLELVMVVGSND